MTRTCFLLWAAVVPLGCSNLEMTSWFDRQQLNEAGPNNPVVDVICIWQPGEGRGLDELPARGFAGQLLFLTQGTGVPAKVDGDIRVYVFDDQGPPDVQSKPIHQFDFESQAFARYFYETKFGAAYQFFIPYTRKGAHEAQCQLRVRFTPTDGGPPVYSKTANITLAGSKSTETASRWNPERRQIRPDAKALTASSQEPRLLSDDAQTATPLSRGTTSIPLAAQARDAQADHARSRLKRIAAQLAEETDAIQPATFETEEPATNRRYRLHAAER